MVPLCIFVRLFVVSTPPSASWRKKGIWKFLPATRRPLSQESRVSRSTELLYGTTDPQTQNLLDINTSSEGIVTFIMDQPTKKRQRNPMSEREKGD